MFRRPFILLLVALPSIAATLPNPRWPAPAERGEALLQTTVLRTHNQARADFGVPPVRWSPELANRAFAYAATMARTGIYAHDQSPEVVKTMGENMWRGPRGVFSYDVMLGLMVEEGRHFRPGVFPDVSRTGRWSDVGHYTQIVWPETTEVGCALASSGTTDYLVCRYAATGNRKGFALAQRRN